MASTVTAIVPTFNRPLLLQECLDSLLAQTRPLDRILVVDDGSTGDVGARVRERYGDRVDYVWKPNGGKSSALNKGLELADTDLIWICDDDDVADECACEHLVEALERTLEAQFAYGKYKLMDVEGGERRFSEPFQWPDMAPTHLFLNLLERMFICQFSMMVRREALQASGAFRQDLIRSQDYEMILRLARRHPGVFVDRVIFFQRQHEGVRGAQDSRFSAADRQAKWIEYDRLFFDQLRADLPLSAFTPPFAVDAAEANRTRGALLQRAVVFSRRGIMDAAVEDVVSAAGLGDGDPPTEGERELALRLLSEPWSAELLAQDRPLLARLRSAGAGAFGRGVLEVACRPLLWRARAALGQRRWAECASALKLALALSPIGVARRFTGSGRSVRKARALTVGYALF